MCIGIFFKWLFWFLGVINVVLIKLFWWLRWYVVINVFVFDLKLGKCVMICLILFVVFLIVWLVRFFNLWFNFINVIFLFFRILKFCLCIVFFFF